MCGGLFAALVGARDFGLGAWVRRIEIQKGFGGIAAESKPWMRDYSMPDIWKITDCSLSSTDENNQIPYAFFAPSVLLSEFVIAGCPFRNDRLRFELPPQFRG